MNTYSAYKDSGEQWLGQIPAHWEMRQWRFLLKENVTPNTDCKETQQLQFKYGEIIPKANQEIDSDTLKIICKYNKVQPNDIMINGLNLNYDFISQRIGMVRTNGIITSAYISLRPIGSVNPSYYNYLLKAMDAQKMFHGMGTGVRLTLSYKELKSKYLPFPTEAEQEAMVAYLDKQTAQIDSAIAREQKMIDLLEERKQIIIQHAVTKGLNPDAKMKDSGIEWIGEMPEHWDLTRLKFFLSLKSGDAIRQEQLKDVGDYPVYGGGAKIGYTNNYNAKKDEIIIGRVGAKCGCVTLLNEDSWATDNALIVKSNIDVRYLYYLLIACDLNKLNVSNAQPLITGSKIKNFHIPITRNKVEQNEIVTFLDEHLVKIDNTISCFERLIALLQERKQIIINEVVTGKIKVS